MAVVSCHLVDDSFTYANRERRYKATYRVKTDDPTDTGAEAAEGALSATPDPLPAPDATFSLNGVTDANAFMQSAQTRRQNAKDERCYHLIDVEWFPKENPDDDWTNDQDPLTRPVRIDDYSEEIEELVEEGWNEEELEGITRAADTFGPICTPAGQQPEVPLTRPRRLQGLMFTFNVATLAECIALRAEFENKLNDAEFYDGPARTVICRKVEFSQAQFAGGSSYREVQICVLYREEGWSFAMVNRGYKFLDLAEMDPEKQLKDAKVWDEKNSRWVPAAEPVNLELDGTLTPAGEVGSVTHWRLNDEADFSGMGVGT